MKRIFVYGSLRKGEYNYDPEGATHVIDGHIKGAQLVGGNAYPWIVEGDGIVLGEVYDFDDDIFKRIERMEIGAGYKRQPVKVLSGAVETDAEAYFFTFPAMLEGYPRIKHGDWLKRSAENT